MARRRRVSIPSSDKEESTLSIEFFSIVNRDVGSDDTCCWLDVLFAQLIDEIVLFDIGTAENENKIMIGTVEFHYFTKDTFQSEASTRIDRRTIERVVHDLTWQVSAERRRETFAR
jgi:hypothetical protein